MVAKKGIESILIVGRPNVGKSTFINRVLKRKRAITLDKPGVTRDILSFPCQWQSHVFEIMDSGGVLFDSKSDCPFQEEVERRVSAMLVKASKILFLTDFKDGIHPNDWILAKALRPVSEKVTLVVNKLDNADQADGLAGFYKLGYGAPWGVSATQGAGIEPLFRALFDGTRATRKWSDFTMSYSVALLGCPNVGKSSLLNAIIDEERAIVSDVPGTTRDAIEVYFKHYGDVYQFIDTAGVRKKHKKAVQEEFYSIVRTKKSIERADLVMIVLDCERGLGVQEKRLIEQAIQAKKNMILFVNKWDKVDQTERCRKDFLTILQDELPLLDYIPILFGSAKDRKGISKLFDHIPTVIMSGKKRIPTAALNQFVQNVVKRNPPTAKYGKQVKVYYATQAEKEPPCFIFFVNNATLVKHEYRRFLEKRIRHYFGFQGNPVKIVFRSHH